MIKYVIADPFNESISVINSMVRKFDQQAEIRHSTSGNGLLSLVLSEKPDVIFLNLDFPDLKGTEICKKLKAVDSVSSIPVILFGSISSQQSFADAILESGADAILTLPLDELSFRLQLHTLLEFVRSVKNPTNTRKSIEDLILERTSELKNEVAELKKAESILRNTITELRSSTSTEKPQDQPNKRLASIKTENQTKKALQESEEKFHLFIEKSANGFTMFDEQGLIVEWNQSMEKITGYKKNECIGRTIWDVQFDLSPNEEKNHETYNYLKSYTESIIENPQYHLSGELIESEISNASGEIRFIETILYPISTNEKLFIGSNTCDITQRKQVEVDLHESEKLYQNLVERLPDGVYKSTHSGKFIEVNPAMVKLLGYSSKEELLAIDIKSELYFEQEDRESVVLQEKYVEMGIFRQKKKDGTEIWVEDHGWYTLDDHGEILFHEGIIRDITERKMAEEVLKESEERFKMLFNKAPIGYQSLNENGYLIDVNETWLDLMGYQKEEVIGNWFGDYLTPEYVDFFKKTFPVFMTNGIVQSEFKLIRKDGSVILIQLEGRIGHTPAGTFKQTHCVISDITERRRTEKALADDRILLRTLIDNIPDPIYVKDTSCRKLISNKADYELLGLSDEKQAIGKTDYEVLNSTVAEQTFNDDLSVIQTAQPIINKMEFFSDQKGGKRFISTTKIPLTNDSGEIIGLVGYGHDITKQKETQQKIIQLSQGVEQSPASIVITDTDGNVEYVNLKFTEITGYEIEEIKGKNPRILQSGYTSKEEYARLWKTITSGNEYHGEFQNRKKNGELYWESVHVSPIRDEAGEIINFMAIKENITNRKNSDLEILKLSVAIDQNPASVVITNTRGVIEYINKKFMSVSGYSRDELIGKIIRILKPGHTSDDVYIKIWNNLFAGKEWKGEHQNRTKRRKKYWESILISPIKNPEGKITNYILLSEDISERKKMEKDLIAAKEKAEESDRLKSAFLANMSHEIRTPLNSILGFSDLLTDSELKPEARSEFADLINSSGNNLLAIINDVLDISKIEAGQITLSKNKFSAQRMISDIQKEYSFKASSKGINLRHADHTSIPKLMILSDESRTRQVLVNFIGNALKFTDSGYIEIGVEMVKNNIQFHVKDTGIGIAKEFHDKIFERFRQVEGAQTRKYGGNGLGLAITKNLAELLGGKIRLESEPDNGSTFYFTLPEELLVK